LPPYEARRWTANVTSLPTEAAEWRDTGLSLTQSRLLMHYETQWSPEKHLRRRHLIGGGSVLQR